MTRMSCCDRQAQVYQVLPCPPPALLGADLQRGAGQVFPLRLTAGAVGGHDCSPSSAGVLVLLALGLFPLAET